MTKWRSLGVYAGLSVDEKVDPVKIASDMKGGPYNAVVMHLISPWNATGNCYPWVFNPAIKKFDLNKRNPVYFDHLKELVTELFKAGINVEAGFFDIYQDPDSDSGTDKHFLYKPFRHNTFNKVLLSDDLYQSWSPDGHGGVNYAWLKWTGQGTDLHFSLVPPFGPAIETNFLRPVMQIFDDALAAYPQRTVMYKYANECFSEADGQGNFVHGGKHLGDGPEVQLYFKQLWRQFGLSSLPNPIGADGKLHHFIESFDWLAHTHAAIIDPLACKKGMDSNRKILHTTLHEFHGCEDPVVKKSCIKPSTLVDAGIDPQLAMFSRDGTSESLPMAALSAKKAYNAPYPFVDIKALFPAFQWDNHNFQHDWNVFYPFSAKMVK